QRREPLPSPQGENQAASHRLILEKPVDHRADDHPVSGAGAVERRFFSAISLQNRECGFGTRRSRNTTHVDLVTGDRRARFGQERRFAGACAQLSGLLFDAELRLDAEQAEPLTLLGVGLYSMRIDDLRAEHLAAPTDA